MVEWVWVCLSWAVRFHSGTSFTQIDRWSWIPGETDIIIAITNIYKIIAPKHVQISKSQKISQLIVHPDIIRTSFLTVCR